MFYITGLLTILFRWIEVMTRNMSAFTRANGIKDNIINVLSQTLYTLLFHITTFLYQFNYTMQTCKEAKSHKINLSVIKMLTSHSTYYSNNIWVIQFHHNFSFMHNFSLKRKWEKNLNCFIWYNIYYNDLESSYRCLYMYKLNYVWECKMHV